jgi:hypothetical protein
VTSPPCKAGSAVPFSRRRAVWRWSRAPPPPPMSGRACGTRGRSCCLCLAAARVLAPPTLFEPRTDSRERRIPRRCSAFPRCRRRDSNPRHADYDSHRANVRSPWKSTRNGSSKSRCADKGANNCTSFVTARGRCRAPRSGRLRSVSGCVLSRGTRDRGAARAARLRALRCRE